MTELDLDDLSTITGDHDGPGSPPSALSRVVIEYASEPALTRTKARYELRLEASRDPQLDRVLRQVGLRLWELSRDLVQQLQPGQRNPQHLDEQTFAVLTFLNGVLLGFARGYQAITTAGQLDNLLAAIICGMSLQHEQHGDLLSGHLGRGTQS